MYTLQHTFQDLMNDPLLHRALGNLFPSDWLHEVPEEKYNITLEELHEQLQTHWGAPYLSSELLACANILKITASKKQFMFRPLWKDTYDCADSIPDADLNNEDGVWLFTGNPAVDNTAFANVDIPGSVPPYTDANTQAEKLQTSQKHPAVILCPGGGYEMLSTYSEGLQLAARLERDGGYKAFILNYRIAPHTYPLSQMDLARAVMHVRKHADEYQIDPDRILVVGASAGGHLCASEALLHEELKETILERYPKYRSDYQSVSARPDGVGLLYPVISFTSEYHEGSFLNNTGGDSVLKDKLSVDLHLSSDYPPVYAFANQDDGCVPYSNTTRLDAALNKAGVRHLCEIFPTGDHGIGLGYSTSAAHWSEHMISFFSGCNW